jgi:creatinine amidohydrolase
VAICFAEDLTAPEFAAFVNAETIGVLPVAAIEPHGPHLPLSTDCDIARGHLSQVAGVVHEDRSVLILPLQTIGLSTEHMGLRGTFSHDPDLLMRAWTSVARTFHDAGGRKLIVISSHGGNSEVVALLVGKLRAELNMLAVSASWLRFGQPEGLFDAAELNYGIHGGDIETSLMLHYRPDAVSEEFRLDFPSAAAQWDEMSTEMKVHGRIRPGWMTVDLNPHGAVGNAAAATAEKGAQSAAHALHGFGELIEDVAAFDLARLRQL